MKRKMNFSKICSLCLMVLLIFLTACGKEDIVINKLSFKEYEGAFEVKNVKFDKEKGLIEFTDRGLLTDEERPKGRTLGGEKLVIGKAMLTFANLQNIKANADEVEGVLQYFGEAYAVIKLDGERYVSRLTNYAYSFERIKFDDFLWKVYRYQIRYGSTVSGGNGLSD